MKKRIGFILLAILVLALCAAILWASLSCATTKGSKNKYGSTSGKGTGGDQGGFASWLLGISSSVKTQELIGAVVVVVILGASLIIIKKIGSRNK